MSDELHTYRRFLPHWRIAEGVYFVTWRLRRGLDALSVLERDQIATVIRHFDGERFMLYAYVVMNDHVHVLVQPHRGIELEAVVHSWKSYSTHVLNRCGRSGAIWQREYYDHAIRRDADFIQKLEYILQNPERRWPGIDRYPWLWCRNAP